MVEGLERTGEVPGVEYLVTCASAVCDIDGWRGLVLLFGE
jgi:hypothetical protein